MQKIFNKVVNKVLYKDFIFLYLKQLLIQNNLKTILYASLLYQDLQFQQMNILFKILIYKRKK